MTFDAASQATATSTRPFSKAQKAGIAAGGAISAAGVYVAGLTLPWALYTYPVGESSAIHNSYLIAGAAGFLVAVAATWGAFRTATASRPWLMTVVTLAAAVAVTYVVTTVVSILAGLTLSYGPVPTVVGGFLLAVAGAFLYLFVVRSMPRRG